MALARKFLWHFPYMERILMDANLEVRIRITSGLLRSVSRCEPAEHSGQSIEPLFIPRKINTSYAVFGIFGTALQK